MIGCESYAPLSEEKDDNSSTQPIDIEKPNKNTTVDDLERVIQSGSDEEFQEILGRIAAVVNLKAQHKILTNKALHYRLMKCFYRKFKEIDVKTHQDHSHLIFLLSLLAELSRRNQKTRLPFTRKIVLALLTFDPSILHTKILTILAVLLQNLARQANALKKLMVEREVLDGLLLLTSRVDEVFTLRILIKAIRQLALPLKKQHLEKHNTLSGIRDHFGDEVALGVRVLLCHGGTTRQQTLKDLIQKL